MSNRFQKAFLAVALLSAIAPMSFGVTPTPSPSPTASPTPMVTFVDSTKTPSRFLGFRVFEGINAPGVVLVDEHGNPVSLSGGGGGGGGDASAANQVTGNNSLASIDTKMNAQSTAAKQDALATLVATLSTNAGAAHAVTSQVTSTGTASTVAIARPTRRGIRFTNRDDNNSVWIGPTTVTDSNGELVGPGQSVPFTAVILFQVIDDGTHHALVTVSDEYD